MKEPQTIGDLIVQSGRFIDYWLALEYGLITEEQLETARSQGYPAPYPWETPPDEPKVGVLSQ